MIRFPFIRGEGVFSTQMAEDIRGVSTHFRRRNCEFNGTTKKLWAFSWIFVYENQLLGQFDEICQYKMSFCRKCVYKNSIHPQNLNGKILYFIFWSPILYSRLYIQMMMKQKNSPRAFLELTNRWKYSSSTKIKKMFLAEIEFSIRGWIKSGFVDLGISIQFPKFRKCFSTGADPYPLDTSSHKW